MKNLRERIEELGRGDFKNNTPKIEISTPFIEINLNEDEVYEGYFLLKSLNTHKMKGMIYTSTNRMQCMNSQFMGMEAKISFRFEAKGICEGKSVKGNFYIISNGGELSLPFVVNIKKQEITSSIGKINNLFHFTNLAASNWNEAFDVFKLPEFRSIFINNDKRFETLYLALTSGDIITNQCMEEFLVGIRKKNPITITINESGKSFHGLDCDLKESIVLHKNIWGYVHIKVSCDCDFIDIDKMTITTEDFIGSSYSLDYYIKKDKLHLGKNFARIHISSVNSEIIYEIVVSCDTNDKQSSSHLQQKELKQNLLDLTNLYISYRCKKTNTNPWAKECMSYINTLLEIDPDNFQYKLLRAQILNIQKKSYEAYELIKQFDMNKKEIKEDTRIYVYYLYLTTFWNKDLRYQNKITEEVKGIYRKKKDWQILCILLYLDTTLQFDDIQKLNMIEEQYSYRSNSPIMYVEAYRIMKADVFLIQKLGKFEIQVLLWAVKNKVLSKEVALQVASLVTKMKEFNQVLFYILTYSYEQYHEKEILSAICRILILGNKTEEKYFKWFSLGVESDVRITRLYEYYMYAIPMDYNENIPKSVLMYFGYHNNLDYRKSALLYERVIKQRYMYPEIFQNYRRYIEEFMLEQLMLKRINEKLAFIYDTMLSLNSITLELANAISEILFGCELYCKKPKVKSVSVVHKHLKQENIYPIINGKAYIHLFTKDYAISFLDQEGNRYLFSDDYQIKSLMDEAFYIKKCYDLNVKNKNVRLNIMQSLISSNLLTKDYLENLTEILLDEEIEDNFKVFLRGIIIGFFSEQDEESLIKYIVDMDLAFVDCFQRSKVLEYLIMNGRYERAFHEICIYGYQDVPIKHLIKLASRLIEQLDFEKNEMLLDLVSYVFQEKKYDEAILKYLIVHFNGPVNKMRDIWVAANRFDVDTYELAERIIVQLLYTNEFIEEIDEIFESYYIRGSKPQIAKAFLTYNAFLFLVSDRRVKRKTLQYIKREQYVEGILNDTCKLAMLKHYSKYQVLAGKEREYVEKTLEEFLTRKIYFKFYEDFDTEILEPYCFEGKHLVEYKTDTSADVYIHYIHEDLSGNGEYKVEKMQQSYAGIYYKMFTVFYGEEVQYYITEDNNSKDLMENDIIIKNDMNLHNSNSRYNMLNDMSVAMQLNDDATLLELMNKYAVNNQMVEHLFKSI